jgi:hypothetical protein
VGAENFPGNVDIKAELFNLDGDVSKLLGVLDRPERYAHIVHYSEITEGFGDSV